MEPKIDLFTPIHKAIRALLYDMGRQLQIVDFGDELESTQTLNRLEHIFEFLEEHARHEDSFIFPPIEQAAPGSTRESQEEHRQYEEKVEQLRKVMHHMRKFTLGKDRINRSGALNRAYTDFMSFYLMHMNQEEETALPASMDKLSNQDLAAIRLKVQMDTDPDRYTEWLYWMLPALNINELIPLFQQVKANAPQMVYEKFVDIGQETIDEKRWGRLRQMAEII